MELKQSHGEAEERRITIEVLAEKISKRDAEEVLIKGLGASRYHDAFGIPTLRGECWFFDYGVLVSWDVGEDERRQICEQIRPVMTQSVSSLPLERYAWSVNREASLTVYLDRLQLPDDEPLTRLALSHAFAQSAKVMFYEERVQTVIDKNAFLPQQLSKTGKVNLSRKMLARRRGELIETINEITLHFDLFDTPEFFWDYPRLEESYLRLAKYLDLQPRVEILTRKLSTLKNMLDMIAEEQNHKHSAFLEWIIIILIAVDIAVYFF